MQILIGEVQLFPEASQGHLIQFEVEEAYLG